MTVAAAVMALAASLGYATSDVFAATAVRRHTASSVALWSQTIGLVFLFLATFVVRPPLSLPAGLWGGLAGVVAAVGVLAFYTALQNGQLSVVAPISATGIVVPLIGGLLAGEPLSLRALIGLLLVVLGALVIAAARGAAEAPGGQDSRAGTPGPSHPAPVHDGCAPFAFARPGLVAVLLSVGAALCFGLFYLILAQAMSSGPADGGTAGVLRHALVVAAAVQLGAFAVTVAAASRHTLACLRPNARLLVSAGAIGSLDVASDVAITYAVAVGPIAVVGPLGSLDPVAAAVIAALFLHERLGRVQLVGVVLCVGGIALITV